MLEIAFFRLNQSGPSSDTKTSKILPHTFSRYNFGKLIQIMKKILASTPPRSLENTFSKGTYSRKE